MYSYSYLAAASSLECYDCQSGRLSWSGNKLLPNESGGKGSNKGAALQAYAVGLVTSLEPLAAFNRDDFLAKLIDYTQDRVYMEKLDRVKGLLAKPSKARVDIELGNGIEAFNSVPTAVYSFLAHPDSFV